MAQASKAMSLHIFHLYEIACRVLIQLLLCPWELHVTSRQRPSYEYQFVFSSHPYWLLHNSCCVSQRYKFLWLTIMRIASIHLSLLSTQSVLAGTYNKIYSFCHQFNRRPCISCILEWRSCPRNIHPLLKFACERVSRLKSTRRVFLVCNRPLTQVLANPSTGISRLQHTKGWRLPTSSPNRQLSHYLGTIISNSFNTVSMPTLALVSHYFPYRISLFVFIGDVLLARGSKYCILYWKARADCELLLAPTNYASHTWTQLSMRIPKLSAFLFGSALDYEPINGQFSPSTLLEAGLREEEHGLGGYKGSGMRLWVTARW